MTSLNVTLHGQTITLTSDMSLGQIAMAIEALKRKVA